MVTGTPRPETTTRGAPPGAHDGTQQAALAFERSSTPMSIASTDGTLLRANRALCDLSGHEADEVEGRPVAELMADEAKSSESELLGRLVAGELPVISRPGRLLRADGGVRDVLVTTSRVDNEDGSIAFFVSQLINRTASVDAERALAVTRNAQEALVTGDRQGRITFWSSGAEAVFGHDRTQILGRPLAELVPERDRPAHEAGIRRLREGGAPRLLGSTVRVIALRRDGSEFPAELSLSAGEPDSDTAYVGVVRDVTERARLETEVRRRADVDDLTGVATRNRFVDQVRALAWSGPVAVLHLDLRGLALINDSLGHRAGDDVLREVGTRLHGVVEGDGHVGRLGGDEFGLVVPGTDVELARTVADRVVQAVTQPIEVDGRSVQVDVAVGVAVTTEQPAAGQDVPGADGATGDELLRRADIALHRATSGGGRVVVYDEDMLAHARRRFEVEDGLRTALAEDQLVLHLQPVVDLRSRSTVGAEALVRWEHPERGLVAPGLFIPVAEASGLIRELGRWVLRSAARQLARWGADGGVRAGLTLAVNVSAQELDDCLPAFVLSTLDDAEVAPSRLTIEVTETAVMRDPATAARVLGELRSAGVEVAIDDFGTGLSSLAYVQRLAPDCIKIDREFVARLPEAPELVAAMTAMAGSLGIETVAEGVETEAQLDAVTELGCDRAQGYHLGRPAPAERFRLGDVAR